MTSDIPVHDSLLPALDATLTDIRHEGSLAPSAAMVALETTIGPAALCLQIEPDTEHIVTAAHRGADSGAMRAVLDQLCDILIGLPVEEAAAQGVARLLHRMAQAIGTRPTAGVLLPRNGGTLFVEAERGLRRLRDDFRRTLHRPSRPQPPELDPAWAMLAGDERVARLRQAVTEFSTGHGMPTDGIHFEALENDVQGRPVRVVVSFVVALSGEALPALIRSLERHLKRALAPQIEVLASERADRNKLRRMIIIEKGHPGS